MAFSNLVLPSVAPAEAGGQALAAMKNIFASNQANLQNQMLKAQVPYAPYQAYANAYLTNQQAQWLPYQYKMQALSNPMLWMAAQNNPQLQEQLSKLMSDPMQGIGGGINIPPPQPQSNGLLSSLFSGNRQNPMAQTQQAPIGAMPQNVNALTQNPVAPQLPQASSTQGASLPTSTVGRAAQGDPLGGVNPYSLATATQKALETTATTEAAGQQQTWKDKFNEAGAISRNNQNNLPLIDKLKDAYGDLNWWERGPIAGEARAVTTAAQDVDTAQNAIADSIARAQQVGHITEKDRNTYLSMKPGRNMTPDAFNHQTEYLKGFSERMTELQPFYVAAQKLKEGLTPQEADAIWIKYAKDRPFYDAKKGTMNEDNLDTWEDYLKPEKIKEALGSKSKNIKPSSNVSSTPAKNEDVVAGQAPPKDTIWMIRPDNVKVPVHKENIKMAQDKYKYKMVE